MTEAERWKKAYWAAMHDTAEEKKEILERARKKAQAKRKSTAKPKKKTKKTTSKRRVAKKRTKTKKYQSDLFKKILC